MTREPQYVDALAGPVVTLGPLTSDSYRRDPRHLLFTLARYKFVAKMLTGPGRVLEVGCGDGFGSRLVAQEVGELIATDFDPALVAAARNAQPDYPPRIEFRAWDPCAGLTECGEFRAAYALDVIEHVSPQLEERWLAAVSASVYPASGVLLLGTPSKESQVYASAISRAGHVNCKTGAELKALLAPHFDQVFSFSMNDEVVHTGFAPMAHYLFALGVR